MIGSRIGQPGHTVVAITENFDPEAVVIVRQLIKSPKQFIQQPNQLLRRTLGRQHRKPNNVSKQNAEKGNNWDKYKTETYSTSTNSLLRGCKVKIKYPIF